jgi:peptidoglycan/LPS O-acetylase OafA/YrhL
MAHRDDIQGLRGVAVLFVVLAHAGVPFLQGGFVGVDVFFVLSGFLITGLLLAQAEKRGGVALGDFYIRRARRILPAAALTLVVTDIAARHLLNFVRAREAVSDSIWAALFGANVHFAQQGSDYFNRGQPPSPFLHFWTLSVEEQFYLVWPSVLALVLLATATRRALLLVVVAAGAASLAWSVHDTAASPVTAYFATFARAWELALGAALAIRAPRFPERIRIGIGWLGLAAIGCAGILFSPGTPFPGYAALLPAVGAALVISGDARGLSCAPLRYVGDRSYAYYLWHWPVLIIATQYAGHELALGVKLLLLAGAFLLSIVSYTLVENPIRRMRAPRGALLLPASVAIVVSLVGFLSLRSLAETAGRIDEAAAAVRPQALVKRDPLRTKPLPAVVSAVRAAERGAPIPWPLTPPVGSLRSDFYSFPDGCTATGHATSSKVCRIGDGSSRKTIVVIGDSHAQMWMPAILELARRDSWAVVPLVKLGCIPRTWSKRGECRTWYRWAVRRASALRPDVALIVASWAGTYDPPRAIRPIRLLSTAMKRSAESVMVVGDPSSQGRDPVDCLLARGATMKTCTSPQQKVQARTDGAIAADAQRNGVGFIDARGWLCARARHSPRRFLCPLIVNKTITALDRGHISKTYALELAAPFRTAFHRELFA